MQTLLSYFIWDPNPGIFNFNIPFLNRPLLWYGFLFALGFLLAYSVLLYLLRDYFPGAKAKRKVFAEQLTLYVIVGALIGARMGDVLFYQNWFYLLKSPLSIFAIWEGGLSSHGGAVGILCALFLFSRKKKISFWHAVDFTVVPTAVAAVFIRIGNFFNQEILGIPTDLPWGVLFLHPADASALVPRHPVQLYESLGYLCIFFLLLSFWKSDRVFRREGRLTGLFLLFVFSFRFVIEFWKTEQSVWINGSLTMGQWLSIPFILLGLFLLLYKRPYRKE